MRDDDQQQEVWESLAQWPWGKYEVAGFTPALGVSFDASGKAYAWIGTVTAVYGDSGGVFPDEEVAVGIDSDGNRVIEFDLGQANVFLDSFDTDGYRKSEMNPLLFTESSFPAWENWAGLAAQQLRSTLQIVGVESVFDRDWVEEAATRAMTEEHWSYGTALLRLWLWITRMRNTPVDAPETSE